jgi:O-antigen/teichoic acid export membrane protein
LKRRRQPGQGSPNRAGPKSFLAGSAARVVVGGSAARILTLPFGSAATAATAAVTIHAVGKADYGYVSLIGTLFLLLPFADLGLAAAVTNATSVAHIDDEHREQALRVIWRVLVRLAAVAAVLIALSCAAAAFGLWSVVLGTPARLTSSNWATAAALCAFAVSVPFGIGQRALVGLGRVAEMTVISASAPVTTLVVTAALVVLGAPAMYLGIAPAVAILISNAVMWFRVMSRLGVTVGDLRRARGANTSLRSTATSYFVVGLGIPIALQTDRMILSQFSTAAALSEYALVAQMYTPALSVVTSGALALWPAYRRDSAQARHLWISALRVLFLFGCTIGVTFFLLAPIVGRWVSGGDISPSLGLTGAFAALLVVMAVHQPSALLLTDARGLRFQAFCVPIMAVVSVALSIVLARSLGATGPVLGSLIAVFAIMLIPGILRSRATLTGDK